MTISNSKTKTNTTTKTTAADLLVIAEEKATLRAAELRDAQQALRDVLAAMTAGDEAITGSDLVRARADVEVAEALAAHADRSLVIAKRQAAIADLSLPRVLLDALNADELTGLVHWVVQGDNRPAPKAATVVGKIAGGSDIQTRSDGTVSGSVTISVESEGLARVPSRVEIREALLSAPKVVFVSDDEDARLTGRNAADYDPNRAAYHFELVTVMPEDVPTIATRLPDSFWMGPAFIDRVHESLKITGLSESQSAGCRRVMVLNQSTGHNQAWRKIKDGLPNDDGIIETTYACRVRIRGGEAHPLRVVAQRLNNFASDYPGTRLPGFGVVTDCTTEVVSHDGPVMTIEIRTVMRRRVAQQDQQAA